MESENAKLMTSVTYLQNTCNKLQNDYNATKSTEMVVIKLFNYAIFYIEFLQELQKKVERETKENEKLKSTINDMSLNLQNLQKDRTDLTNEIKDLSYACDKLVNGNYYISFDIHNKPCALQIIRNV